MTDDERCMRYALMLAERGRGTVEPNPLVGAVIEQRGELVADGWHARFGEAHAEVAALRRMSGQAEGATLYVTLEPCCHTGKTPPCVDAIIGAGIRRVVVAMIDPFASVSGQGIARLRQAGIEVTVGACEVEARRLNRPYLTLVERGRPYVHLKWAMTLDGKLASRTGDSNWISNEASRKIVHELRGRMDAIIVGAGTVRQDDPLLTARPPGPRTATRIVLATKPELPPDCRLLKHVADAPILLAAAEATSHLQDAGLEILQLPTAQGRPSIAALLSELSRRRMTNVLVEGGSAVLGSFLDGGFVDEVHAFIAPMLAGGSAAPSAIGGGGVARIAESLPLMNCTCEPVEGDYYIHGTVAER